MMETAEQIIEYIRSAKKRTPVKVYIQGSLQPCNEDDLQVFAEADTAIIIGDLQKVQQFLDTNKEHINYFHIEITARNSAIPLTDLSQYNARIEPGAIIRDQVKIGDNAIIMMGAIINIGAVVGQNTMIDMNVVLGGRAEIGNNCHIGAGTVIAGVIEPPSSLPVIVEDDVVIGANAVVLEGVRVGKGAVIAAGAVVTENVQPNAVMAGIPAKLIKMKDEKTSSKTQIMEALRQINN